MNECEVAETGEGRDQYGDESHQDSDDVHQTDLGLMYQMMGDQKVIDYNKRVSNTFNYLDADMQDSDCSEDYENDNFFQQTGMAYFKQLEKFQQEQIQANKLANKE